MSVPLGNSEFCFPSNLNVLSFFESLEKTKLLFPSKQVLTVYRGAGSNLGQGGGAASQKRAPYFTLANKQKSLTLKNSLSLLNLYD